MMRDDCLREEDLLGALESGRWPEACDSELRDHVEHCESCQELAVVAGALLDDRRASERAVVPPPPGAVWWRMQLRLERESKETAVRTVSRAHGSIIAATIALFLVAAGMTSLLQSGWEWLSAHVPHLDALVDISSSVPVMAVVGVAFLLLVLAPIAIYLAVVE